MIRNGTSRRNVAILALPPEPFPEPRMFSYLGFELLYFILEILSKRSSLVEISFKRLFRDLQAWLAGSAMQLARLRLQSSRKRDSARFFSF